MGARPIFVLHVCIVGICSAQRVGVPTGRLDQLSVDELFKIEVTSVGRQAQELSKAPAAVFVLTAEDIKRSGATNIPEALQWVPGLTVLRIDGRSWVISARGDAGIYSKTMLLMIDGRSLYTPLFGGVIWDAVDVNLGDVERIEVVRGPGAVMWGPNAVNGVVNIITKRAEATKGGSITTSTGNQARGEAQVRWGDTLGDRLAYRVWGKLSANRPAFGSPGEFYYTNTYRDRLPVVDDLDANSGSLGFRLEGKASEKDTWMVQGDMHKTDKHDQLAYPVEEPDVVDLETGNTRFRGGYIQGAWTHTGSATSETAINVAFTRDSYDYPFVAGTTNNITLDFQQRHKTADRNEIHWGAGIQQYSDDTFSRRYAAFYPSSYTFRVANVVVRDQFQLAPERLMVSAGVRFDYSTYRRLEYQPSIRLIYTPNPKASVWLAVSRAIGMPGRFHRDLSIDEGVLSVSGFPVAVTAHGSKSIRSLVEWSAEMGSRLQVGQRWSVDASAFWSDYARLQAVEAPLLPTVSFDGLRLRLSAQLNVNDAGAGRTYGGEIWGTWQVRDGWRLIPSYSYLNETLWLPASSRVNYLWAARPQTIPHQAQLRSQHDLTRTLRLDVMARARSGNEYLAAPAAVLIGARLAWRPWRSGEMSLSGDNLSDRRIIEAYPMAPHIAIPVRRTFRIGWTQRF